MSGIIAVQLALGLNDRKTASRQLMSAGIGTAAGLGATNGMMVVASFFGSGLWCWSAGGIACGGDSSAGDNSNYQWICESGIVGLKSTMNQK